MKKIILGLIAITTLSFTTVSYAGTDNSLTVTEQQQEQKTEITIDDLPDAVKKSWENSDYKVAPLDKIFQVKSQSEEYVEFIVIAGQGKKAVHFDLEGKFLREKAVS